MKVVIVCLNQKFGLGASKKAARDLSMTYADCADEIERSLVQHGAPLQQVTIKWLESHERQVVKKCLKKDIVSLDYNTFSKYRPLITGDIIYLRLESERVDKLYSPRFALLDLRLNNIVNHIIRCADEVAAAKEIEKIIGERK